MKLKLVALVAVALSILACGGSPCGSLQCDQCAKAGQKLACEALVKSDNEKACEIALGKPDFATCQ